MAEYNSLISVYLKYRCSSGSEIDDAVNDDTIAVQMFQYNIYLASIHIYEYL